MKLHTYFRSSAAYRVRIALNLKRIPYESVPVHLLRGGGEHLMPPYRAINPDALVPTLEDDDFRLGQSLAILEYLEETHPSPALLPAEPRARARVRELAAVIACDIHPVNNLRILRYLEQTLGVEASARTAWYQHWITLGFTALETRLAANQPPESAPAAARFCIGATPSLADCCLIPQVFNAKRFGVDLAPFPHISAIAAHCDTLEAFRSAAPESQADAAAAL